MVGWVKTQPTGLNEFEEATAQFGRVLRQWPDDPVAKAGLINTMSRKDQHQSIDVPLFAQ